MTLYAAYFNEWEVKAEFERAYVSLWPGWLGPERIHELDQLTPLDWGKFNYWLELVANDHEVHIAKASQHRLLPTLRKCSALTTSQ